MENRSKMPMDRQLVPWIKLLLTAAVGAGVVLLLVSVGEIVQLVLVAALLAYLLDPLARVLEQRGLSRLTATSAVFVIVVVVMAGILFALVPLISAEISAMQSEATVAHAQAFVGSLEAFLEHYFGFLGFTDLDLVASTRTFIQEHVGAAVNYVPSLFSVISNVVLLPFIIFFLLKDGHQLKRWLVNAVPNRYFELTLNVLYKMDVQLGNYLRGQALDALGVALLSILALWLLDVDYYVLVGSIAGLANLVPYIGPFTGGVIAVAVSFLSGGTVGDAAAIVTAFTGIQLIDNSLLNPLVVARNVKLHPLVILLAVLIGGKYFGILGLLLAVPAAATGKVILSETASNLRRYRFT